MEARYPWGKVCMVLCNDIATLGKTYLTDGRTQESFICLEFFSLGTNDNSLLLGAVLCIVGHSAASLASPRWMPVKSSTPS